ncbi:hypothetical protein ACHAWT_007813 [Skeletonema menzelii]
MGTIVKVDVIIAVHNAQETLEETVKSAMYQEIPSNLLTSLSDVTFDVAVCCYNDASTDKSIEILYALKEEYANNANVSSQHDESKLLTNTTLLIGTAKEGSISRGAGHARNEAVKLRDINTADTNDNTDNDVKCFHFLCILDSDDIMHPTRIAEQTSAMMSLGYGEQGKHLSENALMGCQFDRIPNDSTWHYATWANSLSDERIVLEQFRECTLLQPTWFVSKSWFQSLGGWLEAPISSEEMNKLKSIDSSNHYRLVHSSELSNTIPDAMPTTLRLAEDTRLFYAHVRAGGTLHLHRTSAPLVSYRHRVGMSQSSGTPRKLLLQLRTKAWEDIVFFGKNRSDNTTLWSRGFAIWGAGRDGKDFLKALSPEVASCVVCFVDVDSNKIEKIQFYDNPTIGRKIPILHFSLLAKNPNECNVENVVFGRVSKEKKVGNAFHTIVQKGTTPKCKEPERKKRKTQSIHDKAIDPNILRDLPVVVCVAMYRTNGALESNVASTGRIEGKDLWHIS